MPDNPRIEELRRRVQRDPASIAFAQLAEEYRRAGRFPEAVEVCSAGLERHPGYVSARVTLGRALIEIGEFERAQTELKQVLQAAPENLAALRGLAEIHHRRGELGEALRYYESALEFARHDPDLEQTVQEVRAELEPSSRAPAVAGGLSFEQARDELLFATASPAVGAPPPPPAEPELASAPVVGPSDEDTSELDASAAAPVGSASPSSAPPGEAAAASEQVALLEDWLDAILADRKGQRPDA